MAERASILVVEDNAPLRGILELGLRAAGYEVSVTGEGGEALRHWGLRQFDVAVIDVELPDMDGFELAARRRTAKNGRTTPVIFMTAQRAADMPARVAAAGGVGLLLKPFRLNELLEAVACWLPAPLARPPGDLANDGPLPVLAASTMKNERLALLEEKLAWLQRHVTEQDKAMLEIAGEIDRLKRQVAELRAKQAEEPAAPADAGERPPHY
jgi:DNA-binding response OmpR family regulator